MTESEKQEAIRVEEKMFKAYQIVRIVGLCLWVIGMIFTAVSMFFEGTTHAILYLIGILGVGWGIVLLFLSSDIDIMRNKRISERLDRELKDRYKEIIEQEEQQNKKIKKVNRKVSKD